MAFTKHGHHIPGTPIDGIGPQNMARCGGPGLCVDCTMEAYPGKSLKEVQEMGRIGEQFGEGSTDPFNEHKPNPIMQFFNYKHLPEGPLQEVSVRFHELAHRMDLDLPNGPEKSVALRKLLEGKDAAVRAML